MKKKLEIALISLSLIIAGIGSYVLLHGHLATPISEWFIMH